MTVTGKCPEGVLVDSRPQYVVGGDPGVGRRSVTAYPTHNSLIYEFYLFTRYLLTHLELSEGFTRRYT